MTFASIIIVGLIVLAAVVLAVWALILEGKKDVLDKMEVKLAYKECQLQEWEDKLTADQKTLDGLIKEMALYANPDNWTLVGATYAVSESDRMKYTTDNAIKSVARNRIAHNIAFDIIRKFPEPHYEDGKYTYKFKVVMEDK